MRLKDIPRRGFIKRPSPITYLRNFSRAMGGVQVYLKRDDMLEWPGGAVRKLDYLFADALGRGADTVITASSPASWHNLTTLLLACREGMKCQLIIDAYDGYVYENDINYVSYEAGGVERVETVSGGGLKPVEEDPSVLKMAHMLERGGRRPAIIPRNGDSPLGNCGYVDCAIEILEQSVEMALRFDSIICPREYGGTQAGLIAGLIMKNSAATVVGVDVGVGVKRADVVDKTKRVLSYIGSNKIVYEDRAVCLDRFGGEEDVQNAVFLLARREGIICQSRNTALSLAGLVHLVREGYFKAGQCVLLLYSGGFGTFRHRA